MRADDLVLPAPCVDANGVQEPLLGGGEARDGQSSPIFTSASAFGPAGIPEWKAKGEAVQQALKPSEDRSLADRTNLQDDVVEEGGAVLVDPEQPLLEIAHPDSSGSGDAGAVVRVAPLVHGIGANYCTTQSFFL
jgi:hypothetical protein